MVCKRIDLELCQFHKIAFVSLFTVSIEEPLQGVVLGRCFHVVNRYFRYSKRSHLIHSAPRPARPRRRPRAKLGVAIDAVPFLSEL